MALCLHYLTISKHSNLNLIERLQFPWLTASIRCVQTFVPQPLWPDWAIYLNLGMFSKPLATINLSKSRSFLGNFCKGVKIINFTSETIFGQLLKTFGNFYLVTLLSTRVSLIVICDECQKSQPQIGSVPTLLELKYWLDFTLFVECFILLKVKFST